MLRYCSSLPPFFNSINNSTTFSRLSAIRSSAFVFLYASVRSSLFHIIKPPLIFQKTHSPQCHLLRGILSSHYRSTHRPQHQRCSYQSNRLRVIRFLLRDCL